MSEDLSETNDQKPPSISRKPWSLFYLGFFTIFCTQLAEKNYHWSNVNIATLKPSLNTVAKQVQYFELTTRSQIWSPALPRPEHLCDLTQLSMLMRLVNGCRCLLGANLQWIYVISASPCAIDGLYTLLPFLKTVFYNSLITCTCRQAR